MRVIQGASSDVVLTEIESLSGEGLIVRDSTIRMNNLGAESMSGVRFESCNISYSSAENLSIKDCAFIGCGLEGSYFASCELERVSFVNCSVRNMRIYKCAANEVSMAGLFGHIVFAHSSIGQSYITHSNMECTQFDSCSVTNSVICRTNIGRSRIEDTSMNNVSFDGVLMDNMEMRDSKLNMVRLFRGTVIDGSRMTASVFSNGLFRNVSARGFRTPLCVFSNNVYDNVLGTVFIKNSLMPLENDVRVSHTINDRESYYIYYDIHRIEGSWQGSARARISNTSSRKVSESVLGNFSDSVSYLNRMEMPREVENVLQMNEDVYF